MINLLNIPKHIIAKKTNHIILCSQLYTNSKVLLFMRAYTLKSMFLRLIIWLFHN
jgi:hypothetical protein